MKRQSLSIAIATFNEEKNLAKCFESVKNIADEIIVVDGQSSDKTTEIAKSYGARIKITTNKPIFHINKQMAIDMCTKDWVLQLDADEVVSPKLRDEILSILESEKTANGYWIPRKNWFLGRFLMKGGVYPDYTMRLYRRGKGKLPQKTVHEQAVVQGEVGYLKNPLIHMADERFARYLLRWSRYVNLLRDELMDKRPGSFAFFEYFFVKPISWFLLTYIRHKGFLDLWQGFVFSFFSSLRFPAAYMRYVKKRTKT